MTPIEIIKGDIRKQRQIEEHLKNVEAVGKRITELCRLKRINSRSLKVLAESLESNANQLAKLGV